MLQPLNLVVLRGGFDKMKPANFDWGVLDRFIQDCRSMNVEPLIQVPYDRGNPRFAARIVHYVNKQKGYDVRFWSIGNEPDKHFRTPELLSTKWRQFRDAMKGADPAILVFGPELGFAYDLNNPQKDWLTPFLQANGDVVDVVSLHYYPFGGNVRAPEVLMNSAFGMGAWARRMREHIQSVTGRDIPLAVTEINLSHDWLSGGEGSSASFSAGMWLAETLGEMAEAGVTMVNVFNAYGGGTIGIIEKRSFLKRPTYYALQLYAHYGDQIVPLAAHVENVSAHAARDSRTGNVTLVLIQRGSAPAEFQLVYNSGQEQKPGAVYFDLNSKKSVTMQLPAQSMSALTLDSQLRVIQTIVYSRDMFNAQEPPFMPGEEQ